VVILPLIVSLIWLPIFHGLSHLLTLIGFQGAAQVRRDFPTEEQSPSIIPLQVEIGKFPQQQIPSVMDGPSELAKLEL
jgi:hypothetical protein